MFLYVSYSPPPFFSFHLLSHIFAFQAFCQRFLPFYCSHLYLGRVLYFMRSSENKAVRLPLQHSLPSKTFYSELMSLFHSLAHPSEAKRKFWKSILTKTGWILFIYLFILARCAAGGDNLVFKFRMRVCKDFESLRKVLDRDFSTLPLSDVYRGNVASLQPSFSSWAFTY